MALYFFLIYFSFLIVIIFFFILTNCIHFVNYIIMIIVEVNVCIFTKLSIKQNYFLLLFQQF